jgi:hypothetical protein
MMDFIKPLEPMYPINDRRFEFDREELTTIELLARLVKKMDEVISLSNTVDSKIAGKEDSINITNKRKLSPSGNFTGSLDGKPVSNVLTNILDNTDKLIYLADQFSDGHTGLVVDGGFFENTAIEKNYDGGIF